MTARIGRILASLALLAWPSACISYYDVTIETPARPKLTVSPFQRVLIAGFLAGGIDDVDANLETVRVLRSQLRSKSSLKIIEAADPLPLAEIAFENASVTTRLDGSPDGLQKPDLAKQAHSETELHAREHIFADVEFWKRLGEEYQDALIVTGTVLFTGGPRMRTVQRDDEVVDAVGRRHATSSLAFGWFTTYLLKPKFIFIDGRSGTIMYTESFREEVVCQRDQNVPALSAYFELMDRVLPTFLGTVSNQKIRTSRLLFK
ncbi:MAG: hypothetical protein HYX76_01060 [Acidobacteria bacterium]|nr:hypothetical protein [Acidobacteriota bacterium]